MLRKYKKPGVIVLILALTFGILLPPLTPVRAGLQVKVAEGGFDVDTVLSLAKKQAQKVCGDEGGYFDANVETNRNRFEIDEVSGQVLGLGKIVVNYSQKCPGEKVASLLKSSGTITVSMIFSGNKVGNRVVGVYGASLEIPTLISLNTSLDNQAWEATISGSKLNGSFDIKMENLDFYASFPFSLNLKNGQPELISAASLEQSEFKSKFSAAMGIILSGDFYAREEGVDKLDQLRRSLPLDSRPLKDIDPLPEVSTLLDMFSGYIACVDRNVQESAIGNPQWEHCLYTAGDVLQRAETYVRQVRPFAAAGQYYLVLAKMWDQMRYYSQYAPQKVKYDKVENCQRAKEQTYNARRLLDDTGAADDMLDKLQGKGGCDGMPLFGINQEQIAADRDKARQEALRKALEAQENEELKKQEEFKEKLKEAMEDLDSVDEDAAEENTKEEIEKNNEQIEKSVDKYLDFINEQTKGLNDDDKKRVQEKIKEAQDAQEELKDTVDAAKRAELQRQIKEKLREAKEAAKLDEKMANEEQDAINQAKQVQGDLQNIKSIKEFMQWMNKQKYFDSFDDFIEWAQKNKGLTDAFEGEYGGLDAFADAAGMIMDYMENSQKYSYDDAAMKTFMDGAGTMLLNRLPVVQAAELLAKGPETVARVLLDMAKVSEDSEIRLFFKVWSETFSPSNAIRQVTKETTERSWADVGRGIAHGYTKIGDAKGVGGKVQATGQAVAASVGGIVVGAAKGIQDVFYYTGKGIGQGAGWLVGKFTNW